MPWHEVSIMDQRREFVGFRAGRGRTGGSCVGGSEITASTAYKWLDALVRR